jgi:hypothetical protein
MRLEKGGALKERMCVSGMENGRLLRKYSRAEIPIGVYLVL